STTPCSPRSPRRAERRRLLLVPDVEARSIAGDVRLDRGGGEAEVLEPIGVAAVFMLPIHLARRLDAPPHVFVERAADEGIDALDLIERRAHEVVVGHVEEARLARAIAARHRAIDHAVDLLRPM